MTFLKVMVNNMATLYEIRSDLEHVLSGGLIVDEETGEVLFDSDNLEKLQAEYEDKLEAVGLFIKNLESDAKAIRAEEQALAARRHVHENKVKRLRAYLLANIGDGQKVKTPRVEIGTRYTEAVDVEPDAELDEAYLRIKAEPNKTAIKEALKAGVVIPGAAIVKNRSLQVK